MAAPFGLNLTYGIKPVNPVAVDSWSGPYEGEDLSTALAAANGSIPVEIRFKSMQVRLIAAGKSYMYWYRDGTANIDLVPFTAEVQEGTLAPAAGSNGEIQYKGVDGNLTASVNLKFDSSQATLTSSIIAATIGFSGSLTRLMDGTPYLNAGVGINIVSGANGSVTIETTTVPQTKEYFFSSQPGYLYTTGSVSISGNDDELGLITSAKGGDVFFYVSGSRDGTMNSLFGGNVVTSGSLTPGVDIEYDLGSEEHRWRNVYTGDLHLKNDRGNWTVIEEEDYLSIRNNKTGKLFRIVMEPI